ncbi:HD domain-containing protein [Neobacillus terrae]|uniref:HD domain-containing protein n=1 Tax=Neobacillus terrae TaxID=3034837 RepID=UPI00140C3124|nr:HD domain-containing protein [Neobacillus terrae]NHM30859.1 bifunctional (p)ppGpp synthetase/guanosine-3',5'-bis(diphosphate) 3'-pyrophosphohydrolase [Neobacillus terrae]
MELIVKALQVASKAHRNQNRKGTDIPYISHPAAVGMILLKAGYGEAVVAAGILHDTIEDTNLELQDIKEEFGAEIAEIVAGCSEPNKELSWEVRKEHTIDFLKTASEEIRAVACADKLHNIRSIIKDYAAEGDAVWKRFNRGREQQEWYYRNLVESLGYTSNFELLKEFQLEVQHLFK